MSQEKNQLGSTGFETTRLGFGAMELAAFAGPEANKQADRLLGTVLDAGINLIDTAPDYGISEELIGKHLAHRRQEFFLASKCGCIVGRQPSFEDGKLEHDFTAANVRAGVEQSLRRMQTDHLDLVQIHSSPSRALIEELGTVEEMLALRDEGKVRFLGMSSILPELVEHIEMGVFDVFQIPYSALQPEHEAVIAQAARAGAGTIIRGGVARGAAAPDHDDAKDHDFWRKFVVARRDLWAQAKLDELLDGLPPMEFMLRFVLGHPDLHTTIVGTSKPEHLLANVEVASRGPLPKALRSEVIRRIAAVGD
jgi:aryl-alcohol dehydrogenase-like predicted oxidoreductase